MANDQSEEKTLPPSKKKLRDARRKGQLARSKDLVTGVTLAGSLLYLMLAGGAIVSASASMFETAGDVASGDFASGLAAIGVAIRATVLHALAPLLVLVPLLAILASLVMLQGIPFSVDPIIPKTETINPAEGFKRLFKLRSLLELVQSLVKSVLILAALVVILAGGLNALVEVPACGMDCVPGLLRGLGVPILASAASLFLAAGLIDLPLQRWLFLRDQKMSFSEAKRERKDTDGSPEIKRERRRWMREAVRLAGGLGLRRATLVVHDGGRTTIGLRYKIRDMPAPVVVCRARGVQGQRMLAEARAQNMPATEDAELAAGLYAVPPGHGIPEHLFRPVALALARAGVV